MKRERKHIHIAGRRLLRCRSSYTKHTIRKPVWMESLVDIYICCCNVRIALLLLPPLKQPRTETNANETQET